MTNRTPANNLNPVMAYEVCPICIAKQEIILLNTQLTETAARKLQEASHKDIGFMEEPCKECQENISMDYVFVQEIDQTKSDSPYTPLTVYRSRPGVWIKKEALFNILPTKKESLQKNFKNGLPMIYVEKGFLTNIGLDAETYKKLAQHHADEKANAVQASAKL